MTIVILDKTKEEIREEIQQILQENPEVHENEKLRASEINKIIQLIENTGLDEIFRLLKDKEYKKLFDYSGLSSLVEKISGLNNYLTNLKERIDLEKFFSKGKLFDFEKLKEMFERKGLKKQFPNFSWRNYKKLITEPVFELDNYDGSKVKYDKFLVKKILIVINQMIFDEMDFYAIVCGKEGSGKSCFSSQLMLYFYWALKYIGLIDYKYRMSKMFFSSITSFIEDMDLQSDEEMFRIRVLDEGNELNRQSFREKTTQIFKEEMRTGRKKRGINIINIQQLGELDLSITVSRANFVFSCEMDNEAKTGTLRKGDVDMYIFPRGKKIYSPFYNQEFTSYEIQRAFIKQLEKKSDYYLSLPKEVLITKFRFSEQWTFDRRSYLKYIKKENKKKRFSELYVTDAVSYILYKRMPPLKNWGFNLKDKLDRRMYDTVQKWVRKLKMRFLYNPDIVKKFELVYSDGYRDFIERDDEK